MSRSNCRLRVHLRLLLDPCLRQLPHGRHLADQPQRLRIPLRSFHRRRWTISNGPRRSGNYDIRGTLKSSSCLIKSRLSQTLYLKLIHRSFKHLNEFSSYLFRPCSGHCRDQLFSTRVTLSQRSAPLSWRPTRRESPSFESRVRSPKLSTITTKSSR